jgi:hypothetical protein
MEEKPKKVLTEAQRLAFLKGREKRLANIEKRRLEKEEEKDATTVRVLPPAILTPNDPPPPEPLHKPKPEPKPVPQEIEPGPEHQSTSKSKPEPVSVVDEDRIASKVAEIFYSRMEAAKPVRKPREKKPKPVTPMSPPPAPRKVANFTWM